MATLPNGTITFLFTDIEGSTRLWEDHPDQMRLVLARHDALIRALIDANDGYIFKTIGDAFCAAFQHSPGCAPCGALAAQQAFTSEPWPAPVTFKFAWLCIPAQAELRDNDYFGPPLNRVARLLASRAWRADAAVVCRLQELMRDTLPAGVTLHSLGDHRLRDLGRPETIFQLLHPDLPAEFHASQIARQPAQQPASATDLLHRQREGDRRDQEPAGK